MNTEQVVEMIDAITEGRYYAHSFETTPNSNTISIEVGANGGVAENEFWFSSFDEGSQFLAKIDNPRIAREIAGALVAWATQKESVATVDENGNKVKRVNTDAEEISAAVLGAPARVANKARFDFSNVIPESMEDRRKREEPNTSREEWYRRNVKRMSQETKNRNLKDLSSMLYGDDQVTDQVERGDIIRALHILRENGAE